MRTVISKDKSSVSKILVIGLARKMLSHVVRTLKLPCRQHDGDQTTGTHVTLFFNITTLVELLGTIMGLVEAFTSAAMPPRRKAGLVSASIPATMNTTAFGLVVAIADHRVVLTTTTAETVDSLEMALIKALNIIPDFISVTSYPAGGSSSSKWVIVSSWDRTETTS